MKALLLSEPGKLGMADMPVPEISDEDILVRVRACGICGSDVHGYDGSSGRRIPPLVMGHEAAGVVERAGAGVKEFEPGDRVTFDSTVYCGRCDFCRRGEVNLCDNRMVLGVSCGDYRRHGAFAEYVAIPARIACKLPDQIPFEHAAVIEALSVAVHAVGRKAPAPDDTVLVIGCGMIGLLVIQVLRARGARRIAAVDVDANRRAMAQRAGATWTFDGNDPRLLDSVRSLTEGRGADVALEAVGRTETVQAAIRGVRKGGTVIVIGNLAPRVELPLQELVTREISLLGSCASSGEYPACIDLMARGAVDVAPLISVTAPLEEGPAWFERLHRGREPLMKVILQP
ncbi:MAG TPA: galactitol-1-phosphate 5-dehydrogenase [Vicinamibacterales bacterium]|nr:galactitol-1-phosphate 5-dehydrogenase [Vicinamibacterales bacterium]